MVIKIWYEVELVATFLGFLRIKGRRVCDVAAPAVDPAGPAADHGMQSGDVILDVAGKSVSSPADVTKEVADLHKAGKRTVLMRVKSNNGIKFVAIPFGNA